MENLPIISIIYGFFLLFMSNHFLHYTQYEFSTIIYGAFFISFGAALYILELASNFGLAFQAENTALWVFSLTFFATSLHIFFRTVTIIKVDTVEHIQRQQ